MTITILLAEEHQIVRQGLRSLLERETGLSVAGEAASGPMLMPLVRDLAPDVVLLDLALPDLQPAGGIPQILEVCPRTKIIALSACAERRFVVNVLKAGASGFLLKDCTFEELAKAIQTVWREETFTSATLADTVSPDYVETLCASEARFRTIFEGARMGIALVDKTGAIVESNPALQRLLGYREEEIRGQKFTLFMLPADASQCTASFRELAAGKLSCYQGEKKYVTKDGRTPWGRLTVSPFQGGQDKDQFAVCLLEDYTVQKQAEKATRTYQEQLRSVASELTLTEERERRRLGTDLHDHVGQVLALAQIKLGAMREAVAAIDLGEPFDEVRRLIEQTIQYTRSLSFELSPPVLYDLGFEAAMEWLAELFEEQHGVTIRVEADRSAKPMDDEMRVILFQMTRNVLANVVRQGYAKHVRVFVARQNGFLQVKVEDDGLGLGSTSGLSLEEPGGMNIFSIQERLKYLGGTLAVESEQGWGTRVTLQVPLKY